MKAQSRSKSAATASCECSPPAAPAPEVAMAAPRVLCNDSREAGQQCHRTGQCVSETETDSARSCSSNLLRELARPDIVPISSRYTRRGWQEKRREGNCLCEGLCCAPNHCGITLVGVVPLWYHIGLPKPEAGFPSQRAPPSAVQYRPCPRLVVPRPRRRARLGPVPESPSAGLLELRGGAGSPTGSAAATQHPLARQVSRRKCTSSPPASGRRPKDTVRVTWAPTRQVRGANCSAPARAVSAQLTTRVRRTHESCEDVRPGVVARRRSRCDGGSRARHLEVPAVCAHVPSDRSEHRSADCHSDGVTRCVFTRECGVGVQRRAWPEAVGAKLQAGACVVPWPRLAGTGEPPAPNAGSPDTNLNCVCVRHARVQPARVPALWQNWVKFTGTLHVPPSNGPVKWTSQTMTWTLPP